MLGKVHVYIALHNALNKSTVENKTRFLPSPFHVSTSPGLTLAGAFRNDRVTISSTDLRSTTEENESGGYVTVPCPSKVVQHSSTVDWLKL